MAQEYGLKLTDKPKLESYQVYGNTMVECQAFGVKISPSTAMAFEEAVPAV